MFEDYLIERKDIYLILIESDPTNYPQNLRFYMTDTKVDVRKFIDYEHQPRPLPKGPVY